MKITNKLPSASAALLQNFHELPGRFHHAFMALPRASMEEANNRFHSSVGGLVSRQNLKYRPDAGVCISGDRMMYG